MKVKKIPVLFWDWIYEHRNSITSHVWPAWQNSFCLKHFL